MTSDLHRAIQIYDVLGKYLPQDVGRFSDSLEYVHAVINNIQAGDSPTDYFTAIQLMTGAEYDILVSSGSEAVLQAFIQGLVEWKVYEMQEFFTRLGYSHGR